MTPASEGSCQALDTSQQPCKAAPATSPGNADPNWGGFTPNPPKSSLSLRAQAGTVVDGWNLGLSLEQLNKGTSKPRNKCLLFPGHSLV